MGLTNYGQQVLADHALGIAVYTPAASIEIALGTTLFDDTGAGTEVTGSGYVRVEVGGVTPRDFLAHVLNTGNQNREEWRFPEATANYPAPVVSLAVFETGGLMLWHGVIVDFLGVATSLTIASGQTPRFNPQDLTVRLEDD